MTKAKVFICSILIFTCISGAGQQSFMLSKPRLQLKDDKIEIYYDIIDSIPKSKYKVWIDVSDSTQNKIIPRSIAGDLGASIPGGLNKVIIWNFVDDSIYLDNGVYVQVHAELILPPKVEEVQPTEAKKSEKEIKRSVLVLQSVIFPGWGLSRINKGKPHWLKGVASYGCVLTSYVYNMKAVTSYNSYLNSEDQNKQDVFYNAAVKEDNISGIFKYSAIGIWVIDFIWTVAGSSKLKESPITNNIDRVFLFPTYEPNNNVSMMTIRYRF